MVCITLILLPSIEIFLLISENKKCDENYKSSGYLDNITKNKKVSERCTDIYIKNYSKDKRKESSELNIEDINEFINKYISNKNNIQHFIKIFCGQIVNWLPNSTCVGYEVDLEFLKKIDGNITKEEFIWKDKKDTNVKESN